MDIEEKDYEGFVRRIEQIDKILQGPIESLIDIVSDGLKVPAADGSFQFKRSLYLPLNILDDQQGGEASQLNTALCCSTLQRIWLVRRRFPKLGGKLKELEKNLKAGSRDGDRNVLELLAEPFLPLAPDRAGFKEFVRIVSSPEEGSFDPYTASRVFWVLLNAGERNAHTATGFFAFFFMAWALCRRFPEPGGVAVGSCAPTAYVTAKCLAPLFNLVVICRRRASLLDDIGHLLRDLRDLMASGDETRRGQRLPLRLDELSRKLHELSGIAISREGFKTCAREVGQVADRLNVKSDTGEAWAEVVESLVRALRELGNVADQGLSEVRRLVEELLPTLVEGLGEAPAAREKRLEELGLHFSPPPYHSPAKTERYWQDLKVSAQAALRLCLSAYDALQGASRQCASIPSVDWTETLDLILRERSEDRGDDEGVIAHLARANRTVADEIEASTREAVQWCEVILTGEIAHASANHLTEFDPAELLSSLFVIVSARKMDSSLRVTDAIGKSLVGVRKDGSWVPGQPFLVDRDLSAWAPTSDIVWMLSSTISRFPDVRVADEVLGTYIDWLERTKKSLVYRSPRKDAGAKGIKVSGWISERNLRPKRIDIWATNFAVNALLGIRELMEFRLWELCEKRFTVLDPQLRLSEIDAVDLGATHIHRLHRRLSRMARQAAGDDYKEAEYSLVLHGPPGSSKTAITEAMATEMWRSSPIGERRGGARLIRITPADFTRKGEDRLDSEARLIFDVLGHTRGITVLFDEIDDLLRARDGRGDASFFKLVVPAMLNRLQDLRDACPKQEICFVLATNYVDRIEPALIRKGRIDRAIPLVYPDRESRRCTLGRHIDTLERKERQGEEWAGWAAGFLRRELGSARIRETDFWPWKAFDTLCKEVAAELERGCRRWTAEERESRAREALNRGIRESRAEISTAPYDAKRRRLLRTSTELREEILHYTLAGVDGPGELLDLIFPMALNGGGNGLKSWRDPEAAGRVRIAQGAVAYLETMLGAGLRERLQEISGRRNWPDREMPELPDDQAPPSALS
jgi:hypothetical protein